MKSKTRPIVGIDLGTTNSAIAWIQEGKPAIVSSPKGERIIPSVVHIDTRGQVLVGQDAVGSKIAMPSRTISAIKRHMGSEEPLSIADQMLLPEEISSLILKELKGFVATTFPDETAIEAVITVPAYFTDAQRRATKRAGELAGFVVERIINEPTAAALAFGLGKPDQTGHILVYDLGGGTFDVSVVEMYSGILEVKASAGNNLLGGEDFDWLLLDYMAEHVVAEYGVDPRLDLRAKTLLKEKAEETKKLLSMSERVDVSIPLLCFKDKDPIGLAIEITRVQFEAMIDDLLRETTELVTRALADAHLLPTDINEVLLVGGSTRIPKVRELIRDIFEMEPRTDVDPDETVALGAAVQAGIKSGELTAESLISTDVAPFSMGISVLHQIGASMRSDWFSVIIPRNTTIPVTRTEQYHTSSDGQRAVSIEIYQGESEQAKENYSLGEFMLEGIPANLAGEEAIDVTFSYNINGILEVAAKCVSNGKEMHISVHDQLQRDSEEEFSQSLERIHQALANSRLFDDEFDFDDEEMDITVEADDEFLSANRSLASLIDEAKLAVAKGQRLVSALDELAAKNLLQQVDQVLQLLENPEVTSLRNALDDLVDMLIDYDMEGED